MGKSTGFLEYKRQENLMRDPAERINDFSELYVSLGEKERKQQAAVCMNCGVPFCQSGMMLNGMMTGCPLHNLIPEWNDEIYRGNVHHAAQRLLKTNPFPEFTGRVCPALCEKACMCGQYENPVTVHDNEKYIIESAFEKGYIKPRIPKKRSKKRIAVVGSGPAGLACGDYLNRRGHNVTIFEREDRPGGLLMYGIPNMKLDKSVIKRRVKLMAQEGVNFICSTDIGTDITPEELKKEYDAIILCCGAKKPRSIPCAEPGKTDGVYFAVDFLTSTTKAIIASGGTDIKKAKDYISAEGKDVVIVGGGDTGNDCIGTCIRHGAKSVTAVEMMPKPPEERAENNPWPQWPRTLKTDYGHTEAIHVFGSDIRRFETTVKEVKTDKKGKIKSVVLSNDEEIPCGLLLIAVGFLGCEDYVTKAFDIKTTDRGNVLTDTDSHRIPGTNIFSAGDMHIGQSLVVRAIAEGLSAAAEAEEYLTGYRS